MSDDNINRIISVILFRGNTGCSWSTRPNYKNIVLMNNRLLIFLVAIFCKIDPITIFHMHFTNIQRAKCRNAFIRIILRRLNYHAHAYICYITNSATRPFIKLGFRTKQFDKSGFIVLPLEKPCNIRRFRLSNPQTVCTFPCFFPYGLKQGKDFYSPLTTLSSSRAELRFASLVEWA